MQTLRHRLRAFAWLALAAAFGLALAPAISHVLAAGGAAGPWATVCSTAAGGDPGSPALPGSADRTGHCPLCGQGTGPLAPPLGVTAVWAVPAPGAFIGASIVVAVAQACAWAAALPRAPPSCV